MRAAAEAVVFNQHQHDGSTAEALDAFAAWVVLNFGANLLDLVHEGQNTFKQALLLREDDQPSEALQRLLDSKNLRVTLDYVILDATGAPTYDTLYLHITQQQRYGPLELHAEVEFNSDFARVNSTARHVWPKLALFVGLVQLYFT